jgi:NAD(P)-dependent dehydrogenase (short-subunit alcohol dehydrogenase family)
MPDDSIAGGVVVFGDVTQSRQLSIRSPIRRRTRHYGGRRCDPSAIGSGVDETLKRLGGIDVLGNNAGISGPNTAT